MWVRCVTVCVKNISPMLLQTVRDIEVSAFDDWTVAGSQQKVHYLTAENVVIDLKASDIGCAKMVDVQDASVSRFNVGW